jgi:hypothetical protein
VEQEVQEVELEEVEPQWSRRRNFASRQYFKDLAYY